jgi:hypothetical protein
MHDDGLVVSTNDHDRVPLIVKYCGIFYIVKVAIIGVTQCWEVDDSEVTDAAVGKR